jgi:membrane-bound serine protease (ClpP class)
MVLAGMLLGVARAWAAPSAEVLIVPIHGTIDEGMAHLVERSVARATADHAQGLVLDVDSFGGLVSAGTEIRDAVLRSAVPVDAYVSGRAWSAAALVTLAARHIAMAPTASIGAAEPIPTSVKTVSALRSEFVATAQQRGRNAALAAAMVDTNAPAPAYKATGTILTLTASDALHAGMADLLTSSLDVALAHWHLENAPRVTADYSLGERLARFATDPTVSGVLLSFGLLGLLIEMQTLHAIAGILGIAALGLFFGTHVYAGFSDPLVVGLAAAGLFGIALEFHVFPGHGLAGILGALALVAAVVLAFGIAFLPGAFEALAIALVLGVGAFAAVVRFMPTNAFMRRIAFAPVQGREYVASEDHTALAGVRGTARSDLRPAGVALLAGKRVDVLTEGDFIATGSPVVVTRVEGARIFVRLV